MVHKTRPDMKKKLSLYYLVRLIFFFEFRYNTKIVWKKYNIRSKTSVIFCDFLPFFLFKIEPTHLCALCQFSKQNICPYISLKVHKKNWNSCWIMKYHQSLFWMFLICWLCVCVSFVVRRVLSFVCNRHIGSCVRTVGS